MKTKLFTIIIAFVLSLGAKAEVSPESKELLSVTFKSSGVVNLTYTALSQGYPKVNIIDSKGSIVFSERIKNNYGTLRFYDISALPTGEYFFEVIDNNTKTVKSIVYNKEILNNATDLKLEVAATETTGKYKLVCKGVDNGPVNIYIYNKSQGMIFEDQIDLSKDFSRIYDLSSLMDDSYVFEVTNSERNVSKEVSLNRKQLSLSK